MGAAQSLGSAVGSILGEYNLITREDASTTRGMNFILTLVLVGSYLGWRNWKNYRSEVAKYRNLEGVQTKLFTKFVIDSLLIALVSYVIAWGVGWLTEFRISRDVSIASRYCEGRQNYGACIRDYLKADQDKRNILTAVSVLTPTSFNRNDSSFNLADIINLFN
jgi:hypothetical protein